MSAMPPYAEPQFHPDEAPIATRTSMLAVTSLVLAVIACCPLVGLLGPLLGVVALVLIMLNPALKGAAIAIAAIIIGVALQAVVLVGFFRVADAVQTRPLEFVEAIEAGDWDQARASSRGRAATATDEEYAAFAQALDARFGPLSDWKPVGPPPGVQQTGEPVLPFLFNATSANGGNVTVIFDIVVVDEVSGEWPFRPRSIEITAADGTTLTFPPAAATTVDPAAAPTDGADAADADAGTAGEDDAAAPAGDDAGGDETP